MFRVSQQAVSSVISTLQVNEQFYAGVGHTKTLLKEVKDQVLLGLWTCRAKVSSVDGVSKPSSCPIQASLRAAPSETLSRAAAVSRLEMQNID